MTLIRSKRAKLGIQKAVCQAKLGIQMMKQQTPGGLVDGGGAVPVRVAARYFILYLPLTGVATRLPLRHRIRKAQSFLEEFDQTYPPSHPPSRGHLEGGSCVRRCRSRPGKAKFAPSGELVISFIDARLSFDSSIFIDGVSRAAVAARDSWSAFVTFPQTVSFLYLCSEIDHPLIHFYRICR
jgi:hypothetical protein